MESDSEWVGLAQAASYARWLLSAAPGLELAIVAVHHDPALRRLLGKVVWRVPAARPVCVCSLDVVDFGRDERIVRRWQLPLGPAPRSVWS